MEEQNNGSNPAFSSSSSFESLSTADLESCGGYSAPFTVFPFPKHPSSSSSFYRKHMAARSPRSPRRFFFSNDDEGAHHFLYSCHLCKKPLGCGRDIYMYRGNTPFCSEECRQEQIEMDEASEKTVKVAQKQQQKSENSSSPSKSEKIHVRVTGTVVAR